MDTVTDVLLHEATNSRYVLRGLKEAEVIHWSKFCASVFSYKPNPPPWEYFHRHYANDPLRTSSQMIRVALHEDSIVASVRIFLRQLGGGLWTGGIGEVCTHPSHRRKGVSRALLNQALTIMADCTEVVLSSLHAAPEFFPLYRSLGYHPGTNTSGNRWSTLPVLLLSSCQKKPSDVVRAQFPQDTKALQQLHLEYSEKRLLGCISRSKEYWNDYLRHEVELWVWKTDESILAWMALTHGRVREFGKRMDVSTHQAMARLVGFLASTTSLELTLPGFVRDELLAEGKTDSDLRFDWKQESIAIDCGWMYRVVPRDHPNKLAQEFVDFIRTGETDSSQKEHFVWPSDSF